MLSAAKIFHNAWISASVLEISIVKPPQSKTTRSRLIEVMRPAIPSVVVIFIPILSVLVFRPFALDSLVKVVNMQTS